MRKREKKKTGREIKSADTCGCSFWKGRKEWGKEMCGGGGGKRRENKGEKERPE